MTDYYVKHNGIDTADGTSIANAWRTIGKGASTIGAGDRLLLVNDYATYGPYWAGNMISSTSGVKGALGTFTDANVNFYDFDGNGNSVRPGDRLLCGVLMTTYTESFWVVSVTDAHTLVLSGTPSASNPITYVIRDQSGTSSAYPAIYWNSGNGSLANNKWQTILSQDISDPAIIAGTELLTRGTDCDLLWINAANQIVRNLEFDLELGGRWGIRCYDPANNNNWATQIIDNIIHGNNAGGQRGITLNSSYKGLILGNEIYNLEGNAGAIFAYQITTGGTIIANNKIHDLTGGSNNCVGICIAGGAAGMSNATVIGNLIYNLVCSSGSYAAHGLQQYVSGNDSGNFWNNIIYNMSNSANATKAYGFIQSNATNNVMTFINNIIKDCYEGIYVSNGSVGQVGYNCLHGCTNNYGGSKLAAPTFGVDILEDPLFYDPDNGDFRIRNPKLLSGGLPNVFNIGSNIGVAGSNKFYKTIMSGGKL